MTDQTVTWRTLLASTTAAVGDPVHARWLCAVAASVDADELVGILDDPATERMVAHLDAMIARRRAGEPLQYVLGRWGFRHLDVLVDPRGLIPRPETELVAGAAIELARQFGPTRTVVDLGTGSGVIGLSAAGELPLEGTTVWLTDVSEAALDLARANLAGLGRAGANVRIAMGSWFDAVPDDLVADVVVCNPPYVADGSADLEEIVAEWEPADALFAGPDGMDAIARIVADAPSRIRPGGSLVLEIGADQGSAVPALLHDAGFVDVEVRRDLAGRDRIAIGRRPTTILSSGGPAGDLTVRHLVNRLDDYRLLHRWLTTPEVLEWYEGRDRSFELADIVADYGPASDLSSEGVEPAIIELGGVPVGYVQLYELTLFAAEFGLDDGRGVWSFDLFVGEPALHGTGLGRRVVRAVAEHLVHERRAREVVIMPYPENERAVRAYEAAGFVRDAVVPEHELHEGVLRDGLRMTYRPRRADSGPGFQRRPPGAL